MPNLPQIALTAITNASILRSVFDEMDGTKRAAHVVIGDSNALQDDNGFSRSLEQQLDSRFNCFDLGAFSAAQLVSIDYGGKFMSRRRGLSGTAFGSSGALLFFVPIVGATWTEGSLTLTLAGGFTSYVHAAANEFVVTGGTNVTKGTYTISSRTSNDAVVLSSSPQSGGAASAIVGYCVHKQIPNAFRKWNTIPTGEADAWRPHAGCGVYIPSGTTAGFNYASIQNFHKQNNFPGNAPVRYFMLGSTTQTGTPSTTLGQPGCIEFNAFRTNQGAQASTIGTADRHSMIDTANPDGTLKWFATQVGLTTFADRMAGSGTEVSVGLSNNGGTGPACLLYMHQSCAERAFGYSCQTFVAQGGQSRRDMADLIVNGAGMADSKLAFLRTVVHQFKAIEGGISIGGNGTGTVVVWLLSQYNDFASGESSNSIGPSPAASNTPAGYTDNAKALITQLATDIAAAATAEGLTPANIRLVFVLCTEWSVSDTPTTGTPPDYSTNAHCEQWGRLGAATDAEYARTTTNVVAVDFHKIGTWTRWANEAHLKVGASGANPSGTSNDRHGAPSLYGAMLLGQVFRAVDFASGALLAGGTNKMGIGIGV